MATFMLTVQTAERDSHGVRLQPGLLPEAFKDRPALGRMIQGCTLELRRRDGSRTLTKLVTYGIAVVMKDGKVFVRGDPTQQPIVLTLPNEVVDADIVPGTEVWLVDDQG